MRNYADEFEKRVAFIKSVLAESGCKGIVFGNSGGKDCALVGILCKAACENTVSVMMPCGSSVNFGSDMDDATALCKKFGIENRTVDITPVKAAEVEALKNATVLNDIALTNIAPRLRMVTLYGIAASENRLVAGTGNRSEVFVGYFTKWGDSGHDFNPIYDLTVTEVYEFLRYLKAPEHIIEKAPSAGLFEGQTDEKEMGLSYAQIDEYLLTGKTEPQAQEKILARHRRNLHKAGPKRYGEN